MPTYNQPQNNPGYLIMYTVKGEEGVSTFPVGPGQRALANEIEQYVAPSARPAYIVQNPNCCGPQTFGCGCSAVA